MVEPSAECLAEHLCQAVHPGVAGAEKGGEGTPGGECVDSRIGWHFQPVNPVDELPPSDDLPDESFGCWERNFSLSEGALRSECALERRKKADVEHRRDDRVEHVGLSPDHEILPASEVCQAGLHEVVEPFQGFPAGHGQGKVLRGSRSVRKMDFQVPCHAESDLVRNRPGQWAGPGRSCLFPIGVGSPVLRIIVPRTARWLPVLLDEDAAPFPHLTIEVLHQQALFPSGELEEVIPAAEELRRGDEGKRDGEFRCE